MPGHGLQLVVVQGGDAAAERDRLLGGQPVVVHDLQRRVGHGQPDTRQRAPAAAHDVEAAAGGGAREPGQAGQPLVDDVGGRHVAVEQHARDRQRADRQAAVGCARAFGRDDGEVDAAAAQVADDAMRADRSCGPRPRRRYAPRRGRRGSRPGGRLARSASARNSLPFSALRTASVATYSTSPDLQRAGDVGEPAQRVQRAVHLLAAEAARGREAAAESADRLLVEQRDRRPAQALVDDQPDRVGADVDDRERRLPCRRERQHATLARAVGRRSRCLRLGGAGQLQAAHALLLQGAAAARQAGVGHEVGVRGEATILLAAAIGRRSRRAAAASCW